MAGTPSARTLLTDAVELLGLVLSVPLAVLLVGTPIVLAIALVLWIANVARSLF